MTANEIRQQFFDFFESKQHKIVASAPIVVKNDPTLMFTNAGMNQFKDYFLGDQVPTVRRIADSQKCLRVSGKHNDLEEVGRDSYHHTMFEMLGNWSFGDYFKAEAIAWAWELLTEVYQLDKSRIYVTVFEGDSADGLEKDTEAADIWKKYVDEDRILYCDKKDNFWEMGDVGPCGPCSELHVDLRSSEERAKVPGRNLVNMDDPMVVEIWNLVFIQYNRKADGSLQSLPEKHIDTGMGFERLCMAMQGKMSNYDTDVFTPFIDFIAKETGVAYTGKYSEEAKSDIAMRVIVDHLRAVSFTIADGELPSNTGAGYVIRRILRRAVRYYYSFLQVQEPFMHRMVGLLGEKFKDVFPELSAQEDFVSKVILEEEKSFLRTLASGLKRIDGLDIPDSLVDGQTAFELYDTYGFPIDLTRMIAEEKGWKIDEDGFEVALGEQKARARADAKRETGDWIAVHDSDAVEFLGYDSDVTMGAKVIKYRTLVQKDKQIYQLVLDKTPFYAEGGGQVGDTGMLEFDGEKVDVLDTKKENDLIINYVNRLPTNIEAKVTATIDSPRRALIENNHSATHLLHAALRQVLGTHVQQKGSLVKDEYLRFDFSHFEKLSDAQVAEVEAIVNRKVRDNIELREDRSLPIAEAQAAGAMMLFGEKYGDTVRMITFDEDYSRELCGGCHVNRTGEIGYFKITSESGIAAGVRRIEAITADAAERYINENLGELVEIKQLFKNPNHTVKNVSDLQEENKELRKQIEQLMAAQASGMKSEIVAAAKQVNGVNFVTKKLAGIDNKSAKTLATNVLTDLGEGVVAFGLESEGKVQLLLAVSQGLTESAGLHAGNIIREVSKSINGGGGGQAFFATAGGTNAGGLDEAFALIEAKL